MTAGEFLAEELRRRGYDGLSAEDCLRGCPLHALTQCRDINLTFCSPGYKQTCVGCGGWLVTAERDPGPVLCRLCITADPRGKEAQT